jgi:hypothetical protein
MSEKGYNRAMALYFRKIVPINYVEPEMVTQYLSSGGSGSARGLDACRSGRAVYPMKPKYDPPEYPLFQGKPYQPATGEAAEVEQSVQR